jgi:NTE family protein
MELSNTELILQEIPLFSNLSTREQSLVRSRCELRDYKKGEIIYKEGSAADAFYCVVLGRVVVYTQDRHENETVLEYLHRGKYFGIISLLTGGPHSVTTQAINDCLLLVIKKEDFDFILKKIPRLAIDLSQTLCRRLKNKDLHQKTIFETSIVSVYSSYSQAGKTIYAFNLALSIHKETHKSLIILDICPKDKTHSLPARLDITGNYPVFDLSNASIAVARTKDFILKNKFGIDLICFHYQGEEESGIKKLISIFSLLVNDYHCIILDLPSEMSKFVINILNQSDLIHLLTSPEPVDIKRTRNLIERLKTDFHFQEKKIKVIINEYKLAKLDYEEQLSLLSHDIFATLPKIEFISSDRLIIDDPDGEYAKAVRRIARHVGDCLVGLALGVGVAYGFCHIGVLKVIEEEKIPIDVISGSSIGSFIAALWAIGKSSNEILAITQEIKKDSKSVWGLMDWTFPFFGFIKGNKLRRLIKKYFNDKTFYDVKLPLRIVASDVKRKESRIFDKGFIADAIMASCSMPGVFMPFQVKEEMLFDGGVINPLPTEALFKAGAKKIIAINVTPSREDILSQYEKIKQDFAKTTEIIKKRKWFSLKEYFKNKFKTNILDIIFSSIEILQSELAQKEAQLADIVLHPDTQGMYWLEIDRAEEFAKRGEEEARKKLDKIWQVINE